MSDRRGILKSDLTGELANSGFIGELLLKVDDDIVNDDVGRGSESASRCAVPPNALADKAREGVGDGLGATAGADPSL